MEGMVAMQQSESTACRAGRFAERATLPVFRINIQLFI